MVEEISLQERHAPRNRCFGCGPANAEGLRIRSYATGPEPDAEVVCDWQPAPRHEAYAGALNGGILGTLMDCHSNWAATYHMMRRDGMETPPCTVTAEYRIKMKRPTPTTRPVHLSARVVQSEGSWVTVEATLTAGGKVTATCTGKFVAVEPGHPAYHRW